MIAFVEHEHVMLNLCAGLCDPAPCFVVYT